MDRDGNGYLNYDEFLYAIRVLVIVIIFYREGLIKSDRIS